MGRTFRFVVQYLLFVIATSSIVALVDATVHAQIQQIITCGPTNIIVAKELTGGLIWYGDAGCYNYVGAATFGFDCTPGTVNDCNISISQESSYSENVNPPVWYQATPDECSSVNAACESLGNRVVSYLSTTTKKTGKLYKIEMLAGPFSADCTWDEYVSTVDYTGVIPVPPF